MNIQKNLALIVIGTLQLFALENMTAQTIVLVNGEPTKVILENNDIAQVIPADLSDYMKDFDNTNPSEIHFQQLPLILAKPIYANTSDRKAIAVIRESEE